MPEIHIVFELSVFNKTKIPQATNGSVNKIRRKDFTGDL